MTDDSFEKKLDRDFLEYLNVAKELFDKVTDANEKKLSEVWLNQLLGKNYSTVSEKCDRNIFLSRLLLQMQNGKLLKYFHESPPSGPLPNAFKTFGFPSDVEGLKGYDEFGFQVDRNIGRGSGDYFESSRDGRTYLATKRIPQGVMAYVAVTINDGEEIWKPQMAVVDSQKIRTKSESEFVKKLGQIIGEPLSNMRRSMEDRDKVIEWMDKIISDCNKWIQGEDPHNMDLEKLFELTYEEYKECCETAELLKYPRKIRTIIMKDIRDQMSSRRDSITKRGLVLDQYEADEYVEERVPGQNLDDVWLQCAKKPLACSTKDALEATYPCEVVKRFIELLQQERILIIEKGEKEANKRISELKAGSILDIKKELQMLKRLQDEYKEYYWAYKEIEKKREDYEKEWREKCSRTEKSEDAEKLERMKREVECEIDQAKRNFEKMRKIQNDLHDKIDEANSTIEKVQNRIRAEEEKYKCETEEVKKQREEMTTEIKYLKKRREELLKVFEEQRKLCDEYY